MPKAKSYDQRQDFDKEGEEAYCFYCEDTILVDEGTEVDSFIHCDECINKAIRYNCG